MMIYNNEEDEDTLQTDNVNLHQPEQVYDGRRQRKAITRRWIDHHQAFTIYRQDRPFQDYDNFPQNLTDQMRNLYPTFAYKYDCATSISSKLIRAATNKKQRSAVNAMAWQPDGRRLVAGYQSGLITLWNGCGFQFEILMKRHEGAILELVWSNNGDYMITVDDKQLLKVWQTNYDVIEQWHIHEMNMKVRQISFSPCDRKFASCSDDTTIKIWDLATRSEERSLGEHGSDVRSVDWHKSRSLIASGGKDGAIRLFDPRDGLNLSTLQLHKNVVTKVQWNNNGNWLLSGGRDSKIRLIDIRMMSEMMVFQGHEKDVFCVSWHPSQEDLFVSGGFTGEMHWWSVGIDHPLYTLPKAHTHAIYHLRYHPLGHILASTGQEGLVKFWVRNRCGDDVTRSSNEVHVEQTAVPTDKHSNNIPGLLPFSQLFPAETEKPTEIEAEHEFTTEKEIPEQQLSPKQIEEGTVEYDNVNQTEEANPANETGGAED